MPIAGLDIGSTGAKITVLDLCGKELHTGYAQYPVQLGTIHEVDPEAIWQAVQALLSGAARSVPSLSAVGVTSFGESFVLLDERGNSLLPSMMYTDPRGAQEAEALRAQFGEKAIFDISGTEPHPMFSLPKLMWIARNRPDVLKNTRAICLIVDYVVYKLSGRRLIDHSLAARTMGLDVRSLRWSEALFSAAGIDTGLLSTPVPSGTDAGAILPHLADELGLPRALRVVVGCHDQVAAAVGSGVHMSGLATDGAGTVQCITPVFDRIPTDQAFLSNHYAVVPFALPGRYCCYAFSFTGGSLTKWFTSQFVSPKDGVPVYEQLESGMADAPTGILALPHFAGAGTPYMDPGAEGALVGLRLSHTPSDLYRALMEGICYEMRVNIEALAASGIPIEALNATGGCAKSEKWLQMKADILNVPVTRMSTDEAGTVGGIMLTGVATGAYKDLGEAQRALVRPLKTYEPRAAMHRAYDAHYQRYKKLYSALRPLLEDKQ